MRNTTLQKMTLVLQNSSLYEIFPFVASLQDVGAHFSAKIGIKIFSGGLVKLIIGNFSVKNGIFTIFSDIRYHLSAITSFMSSQGGNTAKTTCNTQFICHTDAL